MVRAGTKVALRLENDEKLSLRHCCVFGRAEGTASSRLQQQQLEDDRLRALYYTMPTSPPLTVTITPPSFLVPTTPSAEYQPGQGIMAHTDGPFYQPRTATLSLGSDAIMHFSPRLAPADVGRPGVESRPQASLVLRARCLVVFADDAYSGQLHSIDAVTEETAGGAGRAPVVNAEAAGAPEGTLLRRKLRVSLTFRRISADADSEARGAEKDAGVV